MANDWDAPDENRKPIPFAPPLNDAADQSLNFGAHQATLASYWRRLVGYLIDGVLLAAVDVLLNFLFSSLHVGLLGTLIGLALSFFYAFLMISKVDGQTVGMKVMKIRCVDMVTGEIPTSGKAAARSAAAVAIALVSAIVLFIPEALDLLWPAWDKKNQTLHDKVGGTVVVNVVEPHPDTITFG